MKKVDISTITKAVSKACVDACIYLNKEISACYTKSLETEKDELTRTVTKVLLENAELAEQNEMPICQDTGMAIIFVEIGQEVQVVGGDLTAAINEGVRDGYEVGYLRKSVVSDPINRVNTKDNTPAVIHYDIVPGDKIKITVAPKGFGSENMSGLKMLKPSAGIEGVEDFVMEVIKSGGSNPCPPLIIGVGVGGSFEKAAIIAKQGVVREIGTKHEDPMWAEVEQRLLNKINALGIGPAGLGGNLTAMAVHIETFPTHIAGLPVAVNVGCHVTRHATFTIDGDKVVFDHEHVKRDVQSEIEKVKVDGKKLNLPLSQTDIDNLDAGEIVLLSGVIYTARDAAHKRLEEMIGKNEPMPFDFNGAVVYYAGPSPTKPGEVIGSVGPTTSGRMDKYSPLMIKNGLKLMIGKGERSQEVREAIIENKGAYFVAIAGAAAYNAQCVKSAEIIAFDDLGTEAIRRLVVEDLPVIVSIDSKGKKI